MLAFAAPAATDGVECAGEFSAKQTEHRAAVKALERLLGEITGSVTAAAPPRGCAKGRRISPVCRPTNGSGRPRTATGGYARSFNIRRGGSSLLVKGAAIESSGSGPLPA